MKKFRLLPSIYLFLFTWLLATSCQGQKQTAPSKDHLTQQNQSEKSPPDHDPYFIETDSITSPYGPSSITRNMMQDEEGNIWFATWEGIIRYDGNTFVNFTNKEGLRKFHAFGVLKDSKEHLWFSTIGAGIYRYDGVSFQNFTTKDGLPNDRVPYIYEDKNGHIWLGTENGISRYDGQSFTNYTVKDGLPHNDVNSIIEDKNGTYWIGTQGDACFFDGQTFTRIFNEAGKPFTNVRSIIEDSKGKIWLGGNDGLWRYNNGTFSNVQTAFVGYIYEDSNGNIWTSSQSADDRSQWIISRYNMGYLPFEVPTVTQVLKQEGMFFGILEDNKKNIWFGKLDGVGRYDGEGFNYFREK